MSPARPRFFLPASLLILLAGFALRTWGIMHNSLWIDEIWTFWYMDAPVGKFFNLLLKDGAQVPLYYMIQYRFPANNDLMLRLPSLLFGLTGIAVIIAVTYDLYKDAALALAAGILLAANPYHIWFSRTARPYALVFVEALLTSYFFLKLLRRQRTRAIWIGFLVASTAAYLTHFFTLALPLAEYVVIGVHGSVTRLDRRFFRRWFGIQVVAISPLVLWMLKRLTGSGLSIGTNWIPEPALRDVPLAFANLGVGYDHTILWYFIPAIIVLAVGLPLGAASVLRRRPDPADLMWLTLIAATFLPAFLMSALYPIFVDRYLMVCLPAVLLLMLRGWSRLPRRAWTFGLVGLVALTGVIHVAHKIDSGDYTRQDWRAAAHYIAQRYQPGDTFADENPFTVLCVEYYSPHPADIRDHAVPLPDQTTAASRLWIAYLDPRTDIHRQGIMPEFDPFAPDQSVLSDWLIAHRDQVVDLHAFNGVTVILVDLNQP